MKLYSSKTQILFIFLFVSCIEIDKRKNTLEYVKKPYEIYCDTNISSNLTHALFDIDTRRDLYFIIVRIDNIFDAFRCRSEELLDEIETTILKLEKNQKEREEVNNGISKYIELKKRIYTISDFLQSTLDQDKEVITMFYRNLSELDCIEYTKLKIFLKKHVDVIEDTLKENYNIWVKKFDELLEQYNYGIV